jgi:hypothetical protein
VNCGFNVSVLWMLYGLSFYLYVVIIFVDDFFVIFCIFRFFCSEIIFDRLGFLAARRRAAES